MWCDRSGMDRWEAYLALFELFPWQPVVFVHHGAYDLTDTLWDSTQEINLTVIQQIVKGVLCPYLLTLHQIKGICKQKFHSENSSTVFSPPTPRRRNLKTQNFRSFWIRAWEKLGPKNHMYGRGVNVCGKVLLQNAFHPFFKPEDWFEERFQKAPFSRRISVDGRLNCRNKPAFSNSSDVAWTRPNALQHSLQLIFVVPLLALPLLFYCYWNAASFLSRFEAHLLSGSVLRCSFSSSHSLHRQCVWLLLSPWRHLELAAERKQLNERVIVSDSVAGMAGLGRECGKTRNLLHQVWRQYRYGD